MLARIGKLRGWRDGDRNLRCRSFLNTEMSKFEPCWSTRAFFGKTSPRCRSSSCYPITLARGENWWRRKFVSDLEPLPIPWHVLACMYMCAVQILLIPDSKWQCLMWPAAPNPGCPSRAPSSCSQLVLSGPGRRALSRVLFGSQLTGIAF